MPYILIVIATALLGLAHVALGKKEIARFEASAHNRWVSELEVLRGAVEQYIVQNSYAINHAGRKFSNPVSAHPQGHAVFDEVEQLWTPQIDEIVFAA